MYVCICNVQWAVCIAHDSECMTCTYSHCGRLSFGPLLHNVWMQAEIEYIVIIWYCHIVYHCWWRFAVSIEPHYELIFVFLFGVILFRGVSSVCYSMSVFFGLIPAFVCTDGQFTIGKIDGHVHLSFIYCQYFHRFTRFTNILQSLISLQTANTHCFSPMFCCLVIRRSPQGASAWMRTNKINHKLSEFDCHCIARRMLVEWVSGWERKIDRMACVCACVLKRDRETSDSFKLNITKLFAICLSLFLFLFSQSNHNGVKCWLLHSAHEFQAVLLRCFLHSVRTPNIHTQTQIQIFARSEYSFVFSSIFGRLVRWFATAIPDRTHITMAKVIPVLVAIAQILFTKKKILEVRNGTFVRWNSVAQNTNDAFAHYYLSIKSHAPTT